MIRPISKYKIEIETTRETPLTVQRQHDFPIASAVECDITAFSNRISLYLIIFFKSSKRKGRCTVLAYILQRFQTSQNTEKRARNH